MKKGFWFYCHLILGLIFAIPIVIVAVSGAMLSYQDEILKLINPKTYYVEQNLDENFTPEKLIKKYLDKNPHAKVESINFYSDGISSARIVIADPNGKQKRGETFFINPYTAEVLPQIKGREFFRISMTIHRWFSLSGMNTFGKNFVAISTIVLIMLCISGIYLYWLPLKRGFFKAIKISFRKNGYAFMHQLHSAVGVWFLLFYLIMCLTGLTWSYGWYRDMLYKISGVEKPIRQPMPNQQQLQNGDTKNLAYMQDKTLNTQEEKTEFSKIKKNITNTNNLDKSYDIFLREIDGKFYQASVKLPTNNESIFSWNFIEKSSDYSRARNEIKIDMAKEEVISKIFFREKAINERLMSSMLPLHSGEYFGKIGLFLFFISCMLMPLFAITGLMMYLKRRSAKKKHAKK